MVFHPLNNYLYKSELSICSQRFQCCSYLSHTNQELLEPELQHPSCNL